MMPQSDDRFARRTRWNLDQNSLSRALTNLRSAGASILDLTRSNPTDCKFDFDGKEIQRALVHSDILRYVPDPRGILCARQAASAYYNDAQSTVSPDDLVLT